MERHQLFRATKFAIVGDYTLRIQFDDGSEQTIDFLPVLHGPVFGPLRDKKTFFPGATHRLCGLPGMAERC